METQIKQLKGYPQSIKEANESGMSFYMYGDLINLLNFQEYHVLDIKKIATAHARTIRYCGNSKFSVAQHCVRGAEAFLLIGEPQLALDMLIHEVAEAIGISDIGKPVKLLINPILKPIENALEEKIVRHFGGNYPFDPRIKIMDDSLAIDELTHMKHGDIHFDYWDTERSTENFIGMYNKLKIYIENYNQTNS